MANVEKAFHSVLAPNEYVCKAFGMRMFSEVKSTIVHGLNLVYTICVATTLLAAIVFRIHYVSPKYGSFNIIIHSVIFIQQILIATAILAIYYQTIRSPYGMTTVFQMLANVDRAFAQFNVKFDYRLFHWKVLIEIIILTASIHIAFAALCIHYRIDPFVAFIYELLARFYPIFVINVALLTFINLCCLVRSKFMALKKMLSDSHAVDPSDGGSDGVWRVKLVQTMPRTFHDELKQIASVYESLYAIANRLNHIFGLTNLASLSLMAISLTCHLFLMVKILMERPASIDGICIELFVSTVWMLFLLGYITIICHLTVVEADAIPALVQDAVATHEMDEATFIDMELISLQFLHQKLNFTAYGFFDIDMTFVCAVSGAITTYLVILLQFNYG